MKIGDETFHLKWNSYHSHFHAALLRMLETECMVDVTLAAEGKLIHAHQVVLSACSSYFRELLSPQPEKRAIIFLRDVNFEHLKALVDYMYTGQVVVKQNQLSEFLKTAMALSIHGLSQATDDSSKQPVPSNVRPVPASPSPKPQTAHLFSALSSSGIGGPSESDHTVTPEPEWFPAILQSGTQMPGPSSASCSVNLPKNPSPPVERQPTSVASVDCSDNRGFQATSSLNRNLLEQAIKSELEPEDVATLSDEGQQLAVQTPSLDPPDDTHNDCSMLDDDADNSNDDDPLNLEKGNSALPLYTVLGANVDAWQGAARHGYRRQPGPLRVGSFSPYVCGRCGRQYRRQQHLTRHQKSECGAYKTYQCPSCSKGYSRPERLREHMEKAHTQQPAA